MRVRWTLAAAMGIALFWGCYIIVEPEVQPPDKEVVTVPTPVPVPQDGTGGDDGKQPQPLPVPEPLKTGGVGVIWMVRSGQAAAMLAFQYQEQIDKLRASLVAAGLPVDAEVVISTYDGQVMWGRRWDVPAPVKVATALRYYATRTAETLPCTTSALVNVGYDLSRVTVSFPSDLVHEDDNPDAPPPGGIDVRNDFAAFSRPPGAVVVMFIDTAERPAPVTASGCSGAWIPADAWFGGYSPALWVRYGSDGPAYLREQTKFGFMATSEKVQDTQWQGQCLANESFPPSALDSITSSSTPFFDTLNTAWQPLSHEYEFCDAITGQWDSDAFVAELRESLMQVSP